MVNLQSLFNPRTSNFDVPLRVPTWLVSLSSSLLFLLLHLGGCAQAHFSIPNPPPSSNPISSNTQSGFNHYAHMLPEQKPRIQPAPSPPRADAPCSPGGTEPLLPLCSPSGRRSGPPTLAEPFTPGALDIRGAANQIDLSGATTPTVFTHPSSPNSATPKTNTKSHCLTPSMAVL